MSVTQKIDVGYGRKLQVPHGTVQLAPDCTAIEWRARGCPAGSVLDIEIRGDCPLREVCREATAVIRRGPPVGTQPRVFAYRARVTRRGRSRASTLYSEWRDIAVPTPADATNGAAHETVDGDLILVGVSYDGRQVTVDPDALVFVGEHPPVRWDLSALGAASVRFQFDGPAGVDGLGPFTSLTHDGGVWIASGNNGVYGHYSYTITIETAAAATITIDPGIDNLEPPVSPPKMQSGDFGSGSPTTAAA